MIERQDIEDIVEQVLELLGKRKDDECPDLMVVTSREEHENINFLKKYWKVMTWNPNSNEPVPSFIIDAVFLEVDQDLFVKSALGITDTAESLLFSRLMVAGKNVHFVPSKSLHWIMDETGSSMNEAYTSYFLSYKERLENFGVRFSLIRNLIPDDFNKESIGPTEKEHGHFSGKLLTQKDIESWKGERINIFPSTIVTPLARDSAKERGVTISIIKE